MCMMRAWVGSGVVTESMDTVCDTIERPFRCEEDLYAFDCMRRISSPFVIDTSAVWTTRRRLEFALHDGSSIRPLQFAVP